MRARTRRVLLFGLLTLAVVVTLVAVNGRELLERWYLWRLDSGSESAVESARQGLVGLSSPIGAARLLVRSGEQEVAEPTAVANRQAVAEILPQLDDAGLETFARGLDRESAVFFLRVLEIIEAAEIDSAARAAILAAFLPAERESVRRLAAEELSRLGPAAAPAEVALRRAAEDSSHEVRIWVRIALRNLGRFETSEILRTRPSGVPSE